MEQEKKVIKGYKGFDKDLKCRGFQYEVGKEYQCEKAISCAKGFHFCENPFDVFRFYQPSGESGLNRFCKVEGSGNFDLSEKNKICCTEIEIEKEISLKDLFKEGIKFIKKNREPESADTKTYSVAASRGKNSASANMGEYSVAANTGKSSVAANMGDNSVAACTGDHSVATNAGYNSVATNTRLNSLAANAGGNSAAANTGFQSAAMNTGESSAATTTGHNSVATNTGNSSVAVSTGICSEAKSKGKGSVSVTLGNYSSASSEGREAVAFAAGKGCRAKGALGCWIVLTERDEWDGGCYPIKDMKVFKVDGEKIKPDTFYKLVNGEAVEA